VRGREGERAAARRSHLGDLLHALNQPLTGLQCLLEIGLLARDGEKAGPAMQQAIEEAMQLAERAGQIALAMQAVLEIERSEEARKRVDVARQLREAVEELAPVAEAQQARLVFAGAEVAEMEARGGLLEQAWSRTLLCVLGQAAPGETVKVGVEADPGGLQVTVRWCGREPGLSDKPMDDAGEHLEWRLARVAFENEGATWQLMHAASESLLTVQFAANRRPVVSAAARVECP